jgi:hypothetical protein
MNFLFLASLGIIGVPPCKKGVYFETKKEVP